MVLNLINYTGGIIKPTGDITMAELIIDSTISNPGLRYMLFDIKINT